MTCHRCQSEAFKFGIQNGFQRYRCRTCNRTFSDIPARPLDWLRIEPEKAYQVVQMLAEGIGIRSIERLTGLNRRTVLNILQVAGEKCARLLDSKIRNLDCPEIQADELFCFVYSKPQNTPRDETERGEFFTYLAVARESKLIVTWRTKDSTIARIAFMRSLYRSGKSEAKIAAIYGMSVYEVRRLLTRK